MLSEWSKHGKIRTIFNWENSMTFPWYFFNIQIPWFFHAWKLFAAFSMFSRTCGNCLRHLSQSTTKPTKLPVTQISLSICPVWSVLVDHCGALNVLKSSHTFCPRFSVCFSILITSLEEGGAGLCASHTFVCFAYVFCPFSLPLGVDRAR